MTSRLIRVTSCRECPFGIEWMSTPRNYRCGYGWNGTGYGRLIAPEAWTFGRIDERCPLPVENGEDKP